MAFTSCQFTVIQDETIVQLYSNYDLNKYGENFQNAKYVPLAFLYNLPIWVII